MSGNNIIAQAVGHDSSLTFGKKIKKLRIVVIDSRQLTISIDVWHWQ